MRISPIQNVNFSSYQKKKKENPSFKAFVREVKKPGSDEIMWKNNTGIFRMDMSWSDLANFLKEKLITITKNQTLITFF